MQVSRSESGDVRRGSHVLSPTSGSCSNYLLSTSIVFKVKLLDLDY